MRTHEHPGKETLFDRWRTIEIKAELLCLGLRPNNIASVIYQRQNPLGDWKTGNVGIHLRLESGTRVLVTVAHAFDMRSPYSLEYCDGRLLLHRDSQAVASVQEIEMPRWYDMQTDAHVPMPSLFLHEGESFLHQAYAGCDYHAQGLACRFCGTGSAWRIGEPRDIADVAAEATSENDAYHICLGGGTRLPLDRNCAYFKQCLTEIRGKGVEAPVWIEMVPPATNQQLAELVRSGASSFGFNIEVWTDKLRPTACPGKSSAGKPRYLDAMKAAIDLLGLNRVGSCLLVGLEDADSSIAGAETLASLGVQPCMLPFKPWDKSAYRSRPPCKPEELIEVSKAAAQAMIDNAVTPEKNQGCLRCESCTIDHDIYDLMCAADREGSRCDEYSRA